MTDNVTGPTANSPRSEGLGTGSPRVFHRQGGDWSSPHLPGRWAPTVAAVILGLVEKLSVGDAAELAGDVGPDPRLIGVLARLQGHIDIDTLRNHVDATIASFPFLRRRFVRTESRLGTARWETVHSTASDHVIHRRIGTEPEVVAEETMVRELPPHLPPWRIIVMDDEMDSHLLFVAHHVLLDGASAMRIVASLIGVDEAHGIAELSPRRATSSPLGLLSTIALPTSRTSLLTPLTSGFRLLSVSADVDALKASGATGNATLNDVLLAVVAQCYRAIARTRAEHLKRVVVSVPVTSQPHIKEQDRRNEVAAFLVNVPPFRPNESPQRYLSALARRTRWRKLLVRGFVGAPAMSRVLRLMGALGWYQPFLVRQRSIATLLTNLRGPSKRIVIHQRPVESFTPISPAVGNVAMVFAAVSYSGQLRLTVRIDRSLWPEIDTIRGELSEAIRFWSTVHLNGRVTSQVRG